MIDVPEVRLSKSKDVVFDKEHLGKMKDALGRCGFPLEEKIGSVRQLKTLTKMHEFVGSVKIADGASCDVQLKEHIGDARIRFSLSVSMGREGKVIAEAFPQHELSYVPASVNQGELTITLDWQQGVVGAIMSEPVEYVNAMIGAATNLGQLVCGLRGHDNLIKANDAINASRGVKLPDESNIYYQRMKALKDSLETLYRKEKEALTSLEPLSNAMEMAAKR